MNLRTITDESKLKTSELLAECKKLFPVYSYLNDKELDEQFPAPKKPTTHQFRDVQEADEKWKNVSADDLDKKGIKGITLRERLLFELAYFKETGTHLDIVNWTLCTGSRYSDGRVPRVSWCGDELGVRWWGPAGARDHLRVREQISLK